MKWSVFQASTAGPSHEQLGTPCQDAFEAWTDNGMLVIVVADGAGSAKHSELGATLFVRSVVHGLRECIITTNGANGDVLAASRSNLPSIIGEAREKAAELATTQGFSISDLDCTLVGVVATSPGVGFFFHVGDGLAIAVLEDSPSSPVVSFPENGEYSNETWFVTSTDWSEHLRITPFEVPVEIIGVMTDGPMPFVMGPGNTHFAPGFIKPVADYLKEHPQHGNAGLLSIIGSERTKAITDDDKTLVLAFPSR